MICAALALLSTVSLGATTADLTVSADASSVTVNAALTAIFPGSLIGNWDSVENPTGTITRPGLFGGSGNQPVPMTATIVTDGGFSSSPAGGMLATIDLDANTLALDGFSLDLLNGATPALPLTLEMEFETFRTFQPDSVYIGGFTVPIPLGEALITQFTLAQDGAPGLATLTPDGVGGYLVTGALPALVTLEAIVLDQALAPTALPVVLPLVGTLSLDGSTITLELTATMSADETIPGDPGSAIDNMPFDLPTILPPGETAHLLLSAVLESLSTQLSLDLTIVAEGSSSLPGDVDGNGVVHFQDLLAVLGDWGVCGKACPADLNGDGLVGFADLLLVLDNWS